MTKYIVPAMALCLLVSAYVLSVVSKPVIMHNSTSKKVFRVPYLPPSEETSKVKENAIQKECLREALFHEARGEGERGVRAVASVIVNRVKSKEYAGTYCEVIKQHLQFSYVHQMKDTRIRIKNLNESDYEAFLVIDAIADAIMEGRFKPIFKQDVKWYHAKHVTPYWISDMRRIARIGNHVFYRKA